MQVHADVIVTTPRNDSYSFADLRGLVGGYIPQDGIKGNLVLSEPYNACSIPSNEGAMVGAIAMAIRGDCDFTNKIRNVQKAGAIGLIVADNVEGPLILMNSRLLMFDLYIPAVFLSKRDGNLIRDMSNGLRPGNVSFIEHNVNDNSSNTLHLDTVLPEFEKGYEYSMHTSKMEGSNFPNARQQLKIQLLPTEYSTIWPTFILPFVAAFSVVMLAMTCCMGYRRRTILEDAQQSAESLVCSKNDIKKLPVRKFSYSASNRRKENVDDENGLDQLEQLGQQNGDGSEEAQQLHYSELCVICLDEFKNNDEVRVLPCKHEFHLNCIDRWLTTRKRLCPICKGDVLCDETTPLLGNSLSQSQTLDQEGDRTNRRQRRRSRRSSRDNESCNFTTTNSAITTSTAATASTATTKTTKPTTTTTTSTSMHNNNACEVQSLEYFEENRPGAFSTSESENVINNNNDGMMITTFDSRNCRMV